MDMKGASHRQFIVHIRGDGNRHSGKPDEALLLDIIYSVFQWQPPAIH
jgi:hypothetical protein